MKPMTARQVEAWLTGCGCIRSHGVGSHRGWVNPLNGRFTVVPHHGNKTLPQGTLNAIFNQLGIEKPKR